MQQAMVIFVNRNENKDIFYMLLLPVTLDKDFQRNSYQ